MPLTLVIGIVIDPERCAEGQPTVGAAHKHHFGRALSWRQHARQHVNIVIGRTAEMVNCQE
jgi:hypothetical protein